MAELARFRQWWLSDAPNYFYPASPGQKFGKLELCALTVGPANGALNYRLGEELPVAQTTKTKVPRLQEKGAGAPVARTQRGSGSTNNKCEIQNR